MRSTAVQLVHEDRQSCDSLNSAHERPHVPDLSHSALRSAKTLAVASLLGAAAIFVAIRIRASLANTEADALAYFYDQSAHTLFPAARDAIAPLRGTDSSELDAVRAVVVAPRDNRVARRIAYLQTHTPELRDRLAAIRQSKQSSGAPLKALSGDDPFVLKNSLVRRESDGTWYDLTTPQAREILREWTTWTDDSGSPLIVVTP